MKIFKNTAIIGYNGKLIEIPINEQGGKKDVTVEMALQIILNSAPLKTMQDSINGMRLQVALDKAKDATETIELEEGTHDWIKPIAESLCPQIFRINGSLVYEVIKEGFEKAKQPTAKTLDDASVKLAHDIVMNN